MQREGRIAVVVVAYNAESTLQAVLDRIPAEFWPRVGGVWVSDDESNDGTLDAALGWQRRNPDRPVTVVRQHFNRGYGGNQKAGYHWALDEGFDIVVLLHGDGQYFPERLPDIVAPIERGDADAVIGSRMMVAGHARRGGMPRYKYYGNRVLSRLQNHLAGTSLSEWHSGYRAYSVAALREIDFDANSDGFDFDTEILLELLSLEKRIVEVPIPTYYGGEICHVNGVRYARDVMLDTMAWRLQQLGFGSGPLASIGPTYAVHHSLGSSHRVLASRLQGEAPRKILDLGCGDGALAAELRRMGHYVTGVDQAEHPGIADRVDVFAAADLDAGLPSAAEGTYDVVLVADILEHLKRPRRLLSDLHRVLADDGLVLMTVPNFGHWYPRARVLAGAFDYDQRGILDATHLRFFTRRSVRRLARQAGFAIRVERPLGVPTDAFDGGRRQRWWSAFRSIERLALRVRPDLFAYQLFLELAPTMRARASMPHGAENSD